MAVGTGIVAMVPGIVAMGMWHFGDGDMEWWSCDDEVARR